MMPQNAVPLSELKINYENEYDFYDVEFSEKDGEDSNVVKLHFEDENIMEAFAFLCINAGTLRAVHMQGGDESKIFREYIYGKEFKNKGFTFIKKHFMEKKARWFGKEDLTERINGLIDECRDLRRHHLKASVSDDLCLRRIEAVRSRLRIIVKKYKDRRGSDENG